MSAQKHPVRGAVSSSQLGLMNARAWCCVQSGHREQYAIPRALHRAGLLDSLLTDVWVPPGSVVAGVACGSLGRRVRDRFNRDLPRQRVKDCTLRALAWELRARSGSLSSEQLVLAHNAWWGDTAAQMLSRHAGTRTTHVFSYCYEAHPLFRLARDRGLVPVLGQIDPGPEQDRQATEIVKRWNNYKSPFQPGTIEYYQSWREECRLAAHIVVNSEWSKTCLIKTGIEAGKISVCPLIYTAPQEADGWNRIYPVAFSWERPLRVLFLGRCVLLKGVAETIEAAQHMANRPVEFTFVGNTDIKDFESHFGSARIRHVHRVSRAECHAFYREADVFLFPTHSDGFGLTQLEAQAWKLPIIASRFCAEVVRPGETGWLLPEVTAEAIADIIGDILAAPAMLDDFSRNIRSWPFDLEQLGGLLGSLGARKGASV